jgi:hypothetical protein
VEKGRSSLYSFCKATCMKAGPDIRLSFIASKENVSHDR